MRLFTIVTVIILVGIVIGSAVNFFHYKIHAEKIRCSVFKSQADAQAHYRKSLDRNHDGRACTGYPYK